MAKAEYENNQPFLPAEETDHLSDDDMATRVSLSDWKNQQQKELIKLVNSLPAGSISGLVGGQMDGSNVGYPAYDSADFRGTGMSSPDPKDVALWHSLYGDEPVSEGLSALEKQRLFNEGNKRIEAMTQQQLDARRAPTHATLHVAGQPSGCTRRSS